jgi:hypothetical protein
MMISQRTIRSGEVSASAATFRVLVRSDPSRRYGQLRSRQRSHHPILISRGNPPYPTTRAWRFDWRVAWCPCQQLIDMSRQSRGGSLALGDDPLEAVGWKRLVVLA